MSRYDTALAILARNTTPRISGAPRAESEPGEGASFYLKIPR